MIHERMPEMLSFFFFFCMVYAKAHDPFDEYLSAQLYYSYWLLDYSVSLLPGLLNCFHYSPCLEPTLPSASNPLIVISINLVSLLQ